MVFETKETAAEELVDIGENTVQDFKEKLKVGGHMRLTTIVYLKQYYNLSEEEAIFEIEKYIERA